VLSRITISILNPLKDGTYTWKIRKGCDIFRVVLTDIYLEAGPRKWVSDWEWAGLGGKWILYPGDSIKTCYFNSISNSQTTSWLLYPIFCTEKDF